MPKPDPEPTVATAGKAIQELLDANKAVMEAWFSQHSIEQKEKAEEIIRAARARQAGKEVD